MKNIYKVILLILIVIISLLLISTLYHQIMLKIDNSKIIPNGKIVTVNNHNMHVYSEGEANDKPTLIFLSGSGTVSPVYDFKSLYSKLSNQYHIAVVEKPGYGYSEQHDIPRDIDTILYETRHALELSGETAPYILIPHSMSGIEALYWAHQYPDEVSAIIGLDMATPQSYEHFDFDANKKLIALARASIFMGLHRSIPSLYSLNTSSLADEEIQQQRYLMYANAVNIMYIEEGNTILENARKTTEYGLPQTDMLLFISTNESMGDYWVPIMEEFSTNTDSELIKLDCGHYLHYTESDFIAEEIIEYLSVLP